LRPYFIIASITLIVASCSEFNFTVSFSKSHMASKCSCTLSSVASSIPGVLRFYAPLVFFPAIDFCKFARMPFFQPRAFGFCKNSAGSTLCLDFRRPASCDLEYRACFGAGLVAKVLFKKVKIYCRKHLIWETWKKTNYCYVKFSLKFGIYQTIQI